MSKYNKDYYFILKPQDERLPEMTPDEDTASTRYRFTVLPVGSKPLIFRNGALDYQNTAKLKQIDPPPTILFDGSNILVRDEIRDRLVGLDISDLAIQPAIYIDHKNEWHENYWYLTFTKYFECWDRKTSVYDVVDLEDEIRHEVYTYSLDDEKIESVQLKDRQLFKMGGTMEGNVVVHKSIASLFSIDGAVLVPIADFGVTYP
ncbi:hypothetical protein R0381_002671 [Jeongeupia wiesaeckerbachi]|uniref:hypothetical protein n=1 Tax=Jeongeupia wiesaeckerbachi TaxID=3051218 RepID=UPI003D801B0D